MANKNTLQRRRLNPAQPGPTGVISQNRDRNMELVIVGGKTVYRPIDPTQDAWPKGQRPIKGLQPAGQPASSHRAPAVAFGGELNIQAAA